ncbi:MAG: hypothetical protein GY935_18805 [Gammaproteobacteria bacterium]|nr:hypothetical protein [Gammaproteobacteria bacterium]
MKKVRYSFLLIFCAFMMLAGTTSIVIATESLKPFVLAATIDAKPLIEISETINSDLKAAGFEVIGEYSPYDGVKIIAITSPLLRELATRSTRGGYGAVLRVSLSQNNNKIEVAYTNPHYWANAYRMQAGIEPIATQLKSILGYEREFGSGELLLSADDLREYHYTFMMEYFDDPSVLNYFDSHQQAVATVRTNLARKLTAAVQVFELRLGTDSKGKPMTLFGVGLTGTDRDDCSSDAYIMGRIDKDSPRHSAHLPYEILIYGDQAEALYGRFRIAISWPHLPMLASDTGATFFSIMCAPGAIQDALTEIAGGSKIKPGSEK